MKSATKDPKCPTDRDAKWLRGAKPRPLKSRQNSSLRPFRIADLFSGCGGMTLGLQEAARRSGCGVDVVLGVDNDRAASETFAENFPDARVITGDMNELFSGNPGDPLSEKERELRTFIGPIDILLLGAPCQGHSDLNNHTRRNDPKNALYFKAARAAEVLDAAIVIAENVPNAQRDESDVVLQTTIALEMLGYAVDGAVIDVARLGLPQRRRRFVLIASAVEAVDPSSVLRDVLLETYPPRDVRWAIGDLVGVKSDDEVDRPSMMSPENRGRVGVLFDRNLFDLPNRERPPCHRDGEHSYKSVYGRLAWDKPAQTITTGFTSMGQGRYVHPSERRTLTPHEAARLQTIPDWFKWPIKQRTKLARMIGNAVPPLLMVRIGMAIVRTILKSKLVRSFFGKRAKPEAQVVLGRGQRQDAGRAAAADEARGSPPERTSRPRSSSVRNRRGSDRRVASPR